MHCRKEPCLLLDWRLFIYTANRKWFYVTGTIEFLDDEMKIQFHSNPTISGAGFLLSGKQVICWTENFYLLSPKNIYETMTRTVLFKRLVLDCWRKRSNFNVFIHGSLQRCWCKKKIKCSSEVLNKKEGERIWNTWQFFCMHRLSSK